MSQKELDTRFFPLIFDTISHGIFTIDAEGRITSFNRMAEMLTGYTKEEVLGEQCHRVFRADFCEVECPLKRSIKTRERSEAVEVVVTTKDGRKLPIAISTSALIDENGSVLGGVEMFRDLSAVAELRKRLLGSYVFEDIVSKSPSMQKIFEVIPLVANSQSNVLIEGESGTGKELVARAIHNLSSRRNKPFLAINCAALPDQLLESELFGYKKGAFTDAKKDKPGRFAIAADGTILLDEIGDLSPAMQVKLLRVLETKEFTPLGDNTSVKTDFRVIACTNKNLAREVQKKRFRSDLYFRLNVVRLSLPTLAERREDIPLLINHFIERFNALQGRRISRCSERVMAALMGYSFPGNVRELENAIEHAFVVCIGDIIQLEDLPSHIVASVTETAASQKAKFLPLDSAEAETIRTVLAKHFGNRNRTAAELGISRNTLWRKMKRYGIS
ncbi:MAG: PAS domain S-box protein [Candidatus Abyssobacteria bacterium SURF_5]|uniref:PAS domain S-box protein n=1 Tax=Abyssobacteria bacterium (strain SURF_5) TaxID=2093360 RepID=A0A3A4NZZ4_ABYX5|nr:MAG: PAS domain S-box protein [Candidatus Abyssubacteria bacterium SURF_5]